MATTRHLQNPRPCAGRGFPLFDASAKRGGSVSRGWVRNRHDGSVEAVVQGPAEAVEALVEWARHGPPGARVTDVAGRATGEGDYTDFELRPTQ